MKVAVVTSQNAAQLSADDPILLSALTRAGHEALHWRWDDPELAWESVDVALIRSTWDYFERPQEFQIWLTDVRSRVRLINDAEILQWNIDKHYLMELAEAGLPVVPTAIADREGLPAAVEAVWSQGASAIVKPVISGGSWGLHHLAVGDPIEVDVTQGPWLVQPFLPNITTQGELSVILLGGQVSHGIRKFPADGDIRVQDEHGGRCEVEEPSPEATRVALQLLEGCPGQPVYARVDLIERDGALELMEMELFEPELFFKLVPEAADRLAALIC